MIKQWLSGGEEVAIPLRYVIDHPELAVQIVPGTTRPEDLDRPVRWAHVSELRDPAPYLVGQELLLTAGVNVPEDPDEIDRYVRGLQAAGITALGFGLTPPMHRELPPALGQACARHGLPLLVVGVRTPFLAISQVVSVALTGVIQREQRTITAAREALTTAAADGLEELVTELARRLRGWVCLIGPAGEQVVQRGMPAPLDARAGALVVRVRAGQGVRSASTELDDGTLVVAQPVYPQATASQVLVVGRTERLGRADRAIVAVGAALLGLGARAGADAAGVGAAATSLLLDTAAAADVLEEVLGAGPYHVVAGLHCGAGPDRSASGNDWLCTRLGTPLVRTGPGPRFTALVSVPPGEHVLDELLSRGWLAVTGSPRHGDRCAGSVVEVEGLLRRARVLGRPISSGGSRDLGLGALVGPSAADAFAERVLAPVRELDEARGGELLDTLGTWLAHHGGWDRTAAALGVHRNSVRHRIRQVERALDVDLGDPEFRMELWFALRWRPG
jgi:hypothetical protein